MFNNQTLTSKFMKTIIMFLSITISFISFGQNFPGKDVELLLNRTVKPISLSDNDQRTAYRNFYVKFDTVSKKVEKSKKGYRAFSKNTNLSDYSKLVGQEFKVVKIYNQTSIVSAEYGRLYVLELINKDLGTLFYDYDSKYPFAFELEVIGGLDFPEGYYCKDVKTTIDKFTGETNIRSNSIDGISFSKSIKENLTKTYMSINVAGSTLNIEKTGLIILLENGFKIERPGQKINVAVGSKGTSYTYSASIELSSKEIELLLENKITDVRLYIYDSSIKKSDILISYLECINK